MAHINFLGCSPALSSGNVASIIAVHVFEKPTALGGQSIETIRYPRCKHPVSNPQELLRNYTLDNPWQCPDCGNQGQLREINWRKSVGYSTHFVEITAIFPKEALPGDALLDRLSACSQSRWSWFYSRSTL